MINNRFNSKRTANGGFTLVELLVVIGIIAILAGVALGPITTGIKKAKQSGGLQTARTLAVAEFSFANDNDGNYPDSSNQSGQTGTGAAGIAQALVAGKYVSDPGIFFISGDSNGSAAPFKGKTDAAGIASIVVANVSWDFVGLSTGKGLNSNTPDTIPVLWSTCQTGGVPDLTAAGPIYAKPASVNPFGVDGVAVAFKNNGSKFALATDLTKGAKILDDSWQAPAPLVPAVLAGQ